MLTLRGPTPGSGLVATPSVDSLRDLARAQRFSGVAEDRRYLVVKARTFSTGVSTASPSRSRLRRGGVGGGAGPLVSGPTSARPSRSGSRDRSGLKSGGDIAQQRVRDLQQLRHVKKPLRDNAVRRLPGGGVSSRCTPAHAGQDTDGANGMRAGGLVGILDVRCPTPRSHARL